MSQAITDCLHTGYKVFPVLYKRGWPLVQAWLAGPVNGHPVVFLIETSHNSREKEEKLLGILKAELGAEVLSRTFSEEKLVKEFDSHQEKYLAWKKREPGTRR